MKSTKLKDDRMRIVVVTTAEQQRDALLVRAVGYSNEGEAPLRALTDGNDYQATHFVAYVEDEPVGSMRIRWFQGFAKLERSCFVPAFRNARSIYTTAEAVFAHIAKKGYDTVITYAAPKYAAAWVRLLGFEKVDKPSLQLAVSPDPVIELVKRLPRSNDAITPESEGKLMERIEGHWDTPVFYEQ